MTYEEAREAASCEVAKVLQTILTAAARHEEGSFKTTPVVDAALSAFSAAGYEVVPRHCTDEMAAAIDQQDWPTPDIYGDITPGRAPEHIWSAMITAALKERT